MSETLEILEADFNLLRAELQRRGWAPASLLALRYLCNPQLAHQTVALALGEAWQSVQAERDKQAVMESVWKSMPPSKPCLKTDSPPSRLEPNLALPSRDTIAPLTDSASRTPPNLTASGEGQKAPTVPTLSS
jgi:hypothetical protein